MRPKNADGSEWAHDTTQLACREMRAQVIADLRKRDEIRSDGRMNPDNNWAPYTFVPRSENEPERGGVYKVDPVCAAVHHTGEETNKVFEYRWAEFVKTVQDEQPFRERLDREEREREIARLQKDGEALNAELRDGTSMPLGYIPPTIECRSAIKTERVSIAGAEIKRGPGRPRKLPETIG